MASPSCRKPRKITTETFAFSATTEVIEKSLHNSSYQQTSFNPLFLNFFNTILMKLFNIVLPLAMIELTPETVFFIVIALLIFGWYVGIRLLKMIITGAIRAIIPSNIVGGSNNHGTSNNSGASNGRGGLSFNSVLLLGGMVIFFMIYINNSSFMEDLSGSSGHDTELYGEDGYDMINYKDQAESKPSSKPKRGIRIISKRKSKTSPQSKERTTQWDGQQRSKATTKRKRPVPRIIPSSGVIVEANRRNPKTASQQFNTEVTNEDLLYSTIVKDDEPVPEILDEISFTIQFAAGSVVRFVAEEAEKLHRQFPGQKIQIYDDPSSNFIKIFIGEFRNENIARNFKEKLDRRYRKTCKLVDFANISDSKLYPLPGKTY